MADYKDVITASQTPTLDTSAFADKDLMHATVMEFTGVARRAGGSGWITATRFKDISDQGIAMELWLLTASPTNSTLTANSALALHDTDLVTVIDVIGSSTWNDANTGQTSVNQSPKRHFKCASDKTSIYGLLVSRGAGTYAAGGVTVELTVAREE